MDVLKINDDDDDDDDLHNPDFFGGNSSAQQVGFLCNCLTSCSKNLGQFALYWWRGSGWWGGAE